MSRLALLGFPAPSAFEVSGSDLPPGLPRPTTLRLQAFVGLLTLCSSRTVSAFFRADDALGVSPSEVSPPRPTRRPLGASSPPDVLPILKRFGASSGGRPYRKSVRPASTVKWALLEPILSWVSSLQGFPLSCHDTTAAVSPLLHFWPGVLRTRSRCSRVSMARTVGLSLSRLPTLLGSLSLSPGSR
jgi:hypothetical protein